MMKSSMNQIETNDVNDDSEVGGVERSSSRQSPGHAFPGQGTTRQGPLAPGQRWSVARKREVVLGLLRGESSELLSRELGYRIHTSLSRRLAPYLMALNSARPMRMTLGPGLP